MSLEGSMNVSNCSAREGAVSDSSALMFLFQKVLFVSNEVSYERDVYIVSANQVVQVSESQFRFDLREEVYNWAYAIYWESGISDEAKNLMPQIVTYQSDTIYVSGESRDDGEKRKRGTKQFACWLLVVGVSHVVGGEGVEKRIFLDGCIGAWEKVELERIVMKGEMLFRGVVHEEVEGSERDERMIVCVGGVKIERIKLSLLEEMREGVDVKGFLKDEEGVETINSTANCEKENTKIHLPFSFLVLTSGSAHLLNASFSHVVYGGWMFDGRDGERSPTCISVEVIEFLPPSPSSSSTSFSSSSFSTASQHSLDLSLQSSLFSSVTTPSPSTPSPPIPSLTPTIGPLSFTLSNNIFPTLTSSPISPALLSTSSATMLFHLTSYTTVGTGSEL
jgi:hypothetical protein